MLSFTSSCLWCLQNIRIPHKLEYIWQMSYAHGETRIIEKYHNLCKIWCWDWFLDHFSVLHKTTNDDWHNKNSFEFFFYILWFFVLFPCLLFPWKALGKHTRLTFVGMRVILHFDISFPRSPQSFPEPPKKAISLKEQCMQRIPKNKIQGNWFEIQNKVHACTYVCMYKKYVTPMNRNKNTRMYMWQGLRMHATSYALPENTSKSKALFL